MSSVNKQEYHVLNGDALNQIFPKSVLGEKFIVRECLCDGDVCGENLSSFYKTRANFVSAYCDEIKKDDYFKITVPQFEKIAEIKNNSDINLWFEDDVFCQVNFWFIIDFLKNKYNSCSFYLISPKEGHNYSFCSMNEKELEDIYKNKIVLDFELLNKVSSLWKFYKNQDFNSLLLCAKDLDEKFIFIKKAIDAIIDDKKNNRVKNSIQGILQNSRNKEFSHIFKQFSKEQAIYGYGDLQVKRVYDSLKK